MQEEKEQESPEQDGLAGESEEQAVTEEEKPQALESQRTLGSEQRVPGASAPGVEEAVEEEKPVEGRLIQRRGCLRGCLTPIAAIFAIVIIIIMITYVKKDTIHAGLLKRIIANTQNHALSELPADMDRRSIEVLFENVKVAMKEGQLDKEALVEAIEEYHDAMRKMPPTEQKRQEIDKLVAGLSAAIMKSKQ